MYKKKVLFEIKVNNVIDVITNSSSELFVLKGETQEIVEEMIKDIYPDYKNEYEDLKPLKEVSSSNFRTYLDQTIEDNIRIDYSKSKEAQKLSKINYYVEKARNFGFEPQDFYEDWENEIKEQWFYPDIKEEIIPTIVKQLDPDNSIYLLFSKDENPDWDMQEQLMEIGIRYHLG